MIFVLLLYIPECCKTLAMKKILLLTVLCLSAAFSFGQYCTPTFVNPCSGYSMSTAVRHLVGASGSITDTTLCTTTSYEDMSALSCTLNPGTSYSTTLFVSTAYYSSMSVQIWIDFNNDSTFSASESVGGGNYFSTPTPTIALTIPSSVAVGTYKMRLVGNYSCCGGSAYPSISPCPTSSVAYGDSRDYTVGITAPTPTATISPTSLSFGAVAVGSTSSTATCILNAAYLTPSSGSVTVTSTSSSFQVYNGSSWVSSYTISYTGASISAGSIQVQFSPASSGSSTGSICVSGGGLASAVCTGVSGTGAGACSGTPTAGTVVAASYSICGSGTFALTDSALTSAIGILLQWRVSPDSATWTNISGATNTTYSGSISSTSYYRTVVTCAYSGSTSYSPGRLITYASSCTSLVSSLSSVPFPGTIAGSSAAPINLILTGSVLIPTSGSVTITAPSNFEFYLGGSWASSYSLAYTGSTIAAATIPIRFNAPSTAGLYTGNFTVAGGGASTLTVPLSGISAVPCSGTPAAGTASTSVSTATTATVITLTDVGYSSTAGILFQWQSSPTGSGSWSDISGATNSVYSFTGISVTTYYRCNVTCSYSSVMSSTSAISIVYMPVCSGTPFGGTAAASSYYCASVPDTLSVSGYTVATNLTFQWQRSVNGSTGWTVISSAATSIVYTFTPTGDYYYRCAVRCTTSGLTGYSSVIHVIYPYRITSHSITDSASGFCSGPFFQVYVNGSGVNLKVKTFYGDGKNDSATLYGTSSSSAYFNHIYDHSGNYTVKHVLQFGGVPQDSITFVWSYFYCNVLPVSFFYDADSNGTRTSSDLAFTGSTTTQVDSNGVPVDTVTAISGFYYRATGPAGTIYSFRVIATACALITTAPTSGIIYDTISSTVNTYVRKYFGLHASGTTTGYDLAAYRDAKCGIHAFGRDIYVQNASPTAVSPVVKLSLSNKYTMSYCSPSPSSSSGNVFTWNFGSLSVASATSSAHISVHFEKTSASFSFGDTVNSECFITPIAADMDTSNNHDHRCDTVKSGYDPNFIESSPSGHIASGITLRYTVGFENDGNDTAHNISVLDTLSGYLDASTLKPVFASHEMYIEKTNLGGLTIVKFDFPNINLLDSAHHGLCEGLFVYDINVLPGLPDCTEIPARVGIYFDANEVVMTNEHRNIIGCYPADVSSVQKTVGNWSVYPNPATDVLNVRTDGGADANLSISNSMGAVVLQQAITSADTKLNIKNLAPGVYFVKLTGTGNNVVRFLKL